MKSSSFSSLCLIVVVTFVLVCVTFKGTSAYDSQCDCQSHPQELVCDAQFVIKAKIISKVIVMERRFPHGIKETAYYDVLINTVFKGTDIINSRNKTIATTNSDTSVPCGYPNLETGEKYLLTGYQDYDGKLWTENCQWNEKWINLKEQQKQGLMYEAYVENCNCKISPEKIRELDDLYAEDSAMLKSSILNRIINDELRQPELSGRRSKPRYSDDTCAFDISDTSLTYKKSCVRGCRKEDSCKWVRNDEYKNCFDANHDGNGIKHYLV